MSPWWLLPIVPASMVAGVALFLAALILIGRHLDPDGARQRRRPTRRSSSR